jgi:hypothetical protein
MLIVSLRKLSTAQRNNLKKFYKLLVFDHRLHLRKTISQLVKGADVVLIELDLSRVFSISRNIIYKWLKQQDIVNIATTYIYESSKYKSLFKDHINWFIRKLPMLYQRELETVIDDQAYLDQQVKSVYHPEPEPECTPEPEEDTTVSTGSDTVNSGEIKTMPTVNSGEIIKRISVIEKQINLVIERLKRLEGEPVTKTTIDQKTAPAPVGRPTRELKVKQGLKKFIVIESVDGDEDDKIINEFHYRNGIERRKAKKEAEKFIVLSSTSK